MSDFIAMAREGTMYARDGIDLSWPRGGVREVIQLPADKRPYAVNIRITNGVMEEVKGPATEKAPTVAARTVLEGDEARARRAEPAEPVVRYAYDRATDSLKAVPIMGSPVLPPLPETPEQAEINQSVRAIAQSAAERFIRESQEAHRNPTAEEIDEVVRDAVEDQEELRAEDREKADAAAKTPSRKTTPRKTARRRTTQGKGSNSKARTVTDTLKASVMAHGRTEVPDAAPVSQQGAPPVPADKAGDKVGSPAENRSGGSAQLG